MRLEVATNQAEQAAEPLLITLDAVSNTINAFSESIARRAYEIFHDRGRVDGHDWDDWFHAEAEVFHSAHLCVLESDNALAVLAEVPGFIAQELEVSVEPHRISITGKREARHHKRFRKIVYSDRCSDQIFRALSLPVEVDPKKATVALRDGILELEIPKAVYSIIRADDFREWTESFLRLLQGCD
jgi:HSP20 family molecular chaperone IbpA